MLDRQGGTGETSASLYLIPGLAYLDAAYAAEVPMPAHMEAMLPEVRAGPPHRARPAARLIERWNELPPPGK